MRSKDQCPECGAETLRPKSPDGEFVKPKDPALSLKELCEKLDEAGVTIDQVVEITQAFTELANEVGGSDEAMSVLKEYREHDDEYREFYEKYDEELMRPRPNPCKGKDCDRGTVPCNFVYDEGGEIEDWDVESCPECNNEAMLCPNGHSLYGEGQECRGCGNMMCLRNSAYHDKCVYGEAIPSKVIEHLCVRCYFEKHGGSQWLRNTGLVT